MFSFLGRRTFYLPRLIPAVVKIYKLCSMFHKGQVELSWYKGWVILLVFVTAGLFPVKVLLQ